MPSVCRRCGEREPIGLQAFPRHDGDAARVRVVGDLACVCEDIKGPFGTDPTDLTGLSYVAAAEEKTPGTIAPAGSGKVAAASRARAKASKEEVVVGIKFVTPKKVRPELEVPGG